MSNKTVAKLKQSIQDGNYYEAHQMYHSISQRLLKQDKLQDAIQLLSSGILNMAEHQQAGSALDLVEKLLSALHLVEEKGGDYSRAVILDLFYTGFQVGTEHCDQYVRLCIRWTLKHSGEATHSGDSMLHHAFGMRYFKEGLLYDAESHWIHGTTESYRALGHLAYKWTLLLPSEDYGYFIARSVFQLLALHKLEEAKIAFAAFESLVVTSSEKQSSPRIVKAINASILSGSDEEALNSFYIYTSDWLNVTQMLLYAVRFSAGDIYSRVVTEFADVLQKDSVFVELAEIIMALYFNSGPRRKQSNPLASMLNDLFGGGIDGVSSNGRQFRQSAIEMD